MTELASSTGSVVRRVARGVYLVGCNTLLLLLGLEVAARVFAPVEPGPWSRERVGYTLHPYLQTANPPDRRADAGPELAGWWVDPPGAVAETERRRILFLGGSTTKSEYPRLVRERLEPEVGPVTGYNLGADWHCSLHSLYKLWTYADDLRPDLVIVLHAVNDFYRGFTPPMLALPEYRPDYSHHAGAFSTFWDTGRSVYDGRPVFHARPRSRIARRVRLHDSGVSGLFALWVDQSELVEALRRATATGGPRGRARPGRGARVVELPREEVLRSRAAFARNMENIATTCAVKGLPVLFLTMPYTTEVETKKFLHPGAVLTNDGVHYLDEAGFALGMKQFNDVVRGLAADGGAAVLDIAPGLRDPALFEDEVHLSREGLALEAERIADFVLAQGLLE